MDAIISWLVGLKWWQSVAVSGMILLVWFVASVLFAIILCRHIDSKPAAHFITEEELKRRRAVRGFITATKPRERGF